MLNYSVAWKGALRAPLQWDGEGTMDRSHWDGQKDGRRTAKFAQGDDGDGDRRNFGGDP